MMILEGTFDPITLSEIDALKAYRKEKGIRVLYIRVEEEGILARSEREALVKLALKPYRHLHLYTGEDHGMIFDVDSDREALARSGYFRLVPRCVRRELIEKGYYLAEVTRTMCKERRAIHSQGVADTARHLAHVHGLNEKTAYAGGMLHDVTKKFTAAENRKILEVWYPEGLNFDEAIWHSWTAVFWLRQNMGLHDSKLLRAIWHHTLGDGHSALDHILYISDKIEPNRGYDTSYQLALAEKNLQECAAYVLNESKAYILKKEGKHV